MKSKVLALMFLAGGSLFALLRQQMLMLPDAGSARHVYVCGAPAGLAQAHDAAGWQIEVLSRAAGAAPASLLAV